MRIKNAKRMNFVLAAFLAMFLVGTAFAFSAQGPLNFAGVANVDARLQLLITNGVVDHIRGNPDAPTARIDTYIPPGATEGVREVAFTTDFTGQNQEAFFIFTVTNTGTMPAVLTGFEQDKFVTPGGEVFGAPAGYTFEDVVAEWVVLTMHWYNYTHWIDVENETGTIIQPGESVEIAALMEFARFDKYGHYYEGPPFYGLQGSVVHTLSMTYAPAN